MEKFLSQHSPDKNSVEVFVLCGGLGTRLSSIAINGPKPMAPIGDKPFLEYLFNYIVRFGFNNFCFLTGHKGEVVQKFFNQDKFKTYNIRYSNEDKPLGTGGAIKKAIENSKYSNFLILNGDTFLKINYDDFLSKKYPFVHRIALISTNDASRYGTVEIDKDFYVEKFIEKKTSSNLKVENFINGGVYFLNKKILNYLVSEVCSIESEIFPKLICHKDLAGIPLPGRFIDIGIPDDYYLACAELPKWFAEIE